jgi:hypothetical protein
VNSTLGAALAAAKLHVPVAHVEAGLRSFDNTMPEEINRRLTDQLCELLFVTSPEAVGYLANEGTAPGGVHFAGNTMIDTLAGCLPRLDAGQRLGTPNGCNKRLVQRWEAGQVTLPRAVYVRALEYVTGRPVASLGFDTAAERYGLDRDRGAAARAERAVVDEAEDGRRADLVRLAGRRA